jgi:predicted phosphodiesterase
MPTLPMRLPETNNPLLVFGGPYSNLQATNAIREVADALRIPPHNVICTGDVVAYAASPEETASLIRAWGIHVVAGNCEEQLATAAPDCGCGFEEGSACDLLARGWYPFALDKTSKTTRAWMGRQPGQIAFTYYGFRFLALHGGATRNNRFLFASQRTDLAAEAANIDADIILAGHCGIPFASRIGRKTWLNAGVIGMPANDGTQDGWFALLTPEGTGIRITLRRLAYDHLAAAGAMRRSGHANGYARTMVTGIWPSHDVLPAHENSQTGQKLRQKSFLVSAPIAVPA